MRINKKYLAAFGGIIILGVAAYIGVSQFSTTSGEDLSTIKDDSGGYFAAETAPAMPSTDTTSSPEQPTEPAGTNTSQVADDYKDCGSSRACFDQAFTTCSRAELTVDNDGMVHRETIEGNKAGICVITLIYTDTPYPEGAGPDIADKELICNVPQDADYQSYFEGNRDRFTENCSGPLLEVMLQMNS